MRFNWTTLHVRDIETSLKFYQELVGLPLKRRFSPNGVIQLAFLGNEGESELELYCAPDDPKASVQGISIGFTIKGRLEDTIAAFNKAGYPTISPIYQPAPNMRFVHISDPDGFDVQLIESKE
ncbi:MAG: VOC family protein [Eubacteriales bacterium]